MPVEEASSEETPYGRYVTWTAGSSSAWRRHLPCATTRRWWSTRSRRARLGSGPRRQREGRLTGRPERALPRGERSRKGFSFSRRVHAHRRRRGTDAAAMGLLPLPRQTRHVIVGGGNAVRVLMIGSRPETETIRYPVSEVAEHTAHPSRRRPPSPTRRTPTGPATTSRYAFPGRSGRTRRRLRVQRALDLARRLRAASAAGPCADPSRASRSGR